MIAFKGDDPLPPGVWAIREPIVLLSGESVADAVRRYWADGKIVRAARDSPGASIRNRPEVPAGPVAPGGASDG